MTNVNFNAPRLFVDHDLVLGGTIPLNEAQEHYVFHVLRMKSGAMFFIFNGRDGLWLAQVLARQKKQCLAKIVSLECTQPKSGLVEYIFAPLKHARLDYMVQKGVEMGAARLVPVITDFTQIHRLNSERMRANVIEAAEQCEILNLPSVSPPIQFAKFLENFPQDQLLIFCNEAAESQNRLLCLQKARLRWVNGTKISVLVGPEGGFSSNEREALLQRPMTINLHLGQRILRADTAAVAALALVQAVFEQE